MGLRTFLVKRAAQTLVTILVVLTLMFVLFRLMPGDPTSFIIQPGLSPLERDAQRVAFGFARWESAPGVFKRGTFEVPDRGLYRMSINVTDSKGNTLTLYAAYTDPPVVPPGSPLIIRSIESTPSDHLFVGDTVTLAVQVIPSNGSVALSSLEAWAVIAPPTGPAANQTMTLSPQHLFMTTYTASETGVYPVQIGVRNPASGDVALSPFGFAANPTAAGIGSFRYVTTENAQGPIFTSRSPYTRDSAELTVIVTSTAGDITDPEGTVRWTNSLGTPQTDTFPLSHPLIAVARPVYEEFYYYMTGMLTGNFGTSFQSGRSVGQEMGERVGPTLLLFGVATIVSIFLGILGGVLMAWLRGSKVELAAIVSSLFFYSMPIFWFGLILLFLFAYTWHFFPLGGYGCIDSQGLPLTGLSCTADVLWHMFLPMVNLIILNIAGYILLMRNSLMEVLGEDFVTVARAKGLKERTVMYKHAARNAMLPVTTVIALAMAGVISGGVLTETIFSWPGMGYYLVQRTLSQDFPAVQAAFFILALLTIVGNVIADIAYAYLDPRVRL